MGNQFSMLLSAYVLLSKLRNEMLRYTKLEKSYCATSHFTQQELFNDIVSRLVTS